jgi:hypothetical protein
MENEFTDLRLKCLRLVVSLSEAMEDHERSAFIRELATLVIGRSTAPVRKAGVIQMQPPLGLTREEQELVKRLSDATDRLSSLGNAEDRF